MRKESGFFFQAEDGIRDLVRSRGLGDVYKRQRLHRTRLVFLTNHKSEERHPKEIQLIRKAQEILILSLIHI